MTLPGLGRAIDERFLHHRLRSTSTAGVITSVLATCLFAYRYYVGHVANWDLLAVSVTFVVVKLALLLWYRLTD